MKDNRLDINEIFYSIDGEGVSAGELAIFIRLNGCNLRCSYCDTGYALYPKEDYYSFEELYNKINQYPSKNITLTGGEPLCQDGAIDFIKGLVDRGYRVNIETNGSISIESLIRIKNTIVTLDIKTPSSNMEEANLYDNLSCLRKSDVVKFVVGSINDLDFAYDTIGKYETNAQVFLSPVFTNIDPVNIVDYMKNKGDDRFKLQLQMHKYIWDPSEKGV